MRRLLVLFVFSSFLGFSQENDFKELNELFDLLQSKNKVMGSLSIMKEGRYVYKKSIGLQYQVLNDEKIANENSKYRVGSVTKVFTATMIFQLLDEKKINLEDNLAKYYPKLPNASKITIANLLNHSSGLFNVTEEENFNKWMLKPSTHEQMLARVIAGGSVFEPGEKNAYSNSNYIVLGYILEKIDGNHYKESLKKRIVDKLNLKNTNYGTPIDIANNDCQSYYLEKGELKEAKETDMSNPGGAGAIVSTPSDLVVFINALFNNKLISPESLNYMTSKSRDPHCNGIMTLERGGEVVFGHGGGIDGFHSFLLFVPKTKTAIAVTLNLAKYGVQPIIFHALDAVNGKSFDMPSFSKIKLTEKEALTYEGVYENKELPFDLTFKAFGKILKAGPNSNELMNLQATKKDEFSLEAMGVTLKFDLVNNTVLFNDQTGTPKIFTKKQ